MCLTVLGQVRWIWSHQRDWWYSLGTSNRCLYRLKHVVEPRRCGRALSQIEPSHFDPYLAVLSHVIPRNVTLKSLADGRWPLTHTLPWRDAPAVCRNVLWPKCVRGASRRCSSFKPFEHADSRNEFNSDLNSTRGMRGVLETLVSFATVSARGFVLYCAPCLNSQH